MAQPATLIAEAKCIDCEIPPGLQTAVLIALFSNIAGMSADPKTLMNEARCIAACVPPGMMMPILISLASTIADNGGGGGGGGSGSGQIVYYTGGDPNTDGVVPADQTKAAIAVKPGATTYTWNKDLLTWDVP